MKLLAALSITVLLFGCASVEKTLEQGFLPGGDYVSYPTISPVNLNGKHFNLVISDSRKTDKIGCSSLLLPRDTELEGAQGFSFFQGYMQKMVADSGGIIDPESNTTIRIQLTGISGAIHGFGYATAWGLVEFKVASGTHSKVYCSAMADGDQDSPLGRNALVTRKGAFRKMVSGSTRRAVEEFLHDLEKNRL